MEMLSWQQYGLKKDPFDTTPLVEGGDIPIKIAFIGRDKERDYLDETFANHDRVCQVICGDVGIGKTSLANFQKFHWKYSQIKLLFSARREIEAHEDLLNKRSFLLELLSSTLREIELMDNSLLKKDPLQKIRQLTDITQTLSISGGLSGGIPAFSIGGQMSSEKNITLPPQIPMTTLESLFLDLIEFIKNNEIKDKKYSGIIFHINNFDIVLKDPKNQHKIIKFFNEIRNILQTKDTYFIFLGPKNFFKDIIAKEARVKSIFEPSPLMLNPLGKKEIVRALDERMRLLQSDGVEKYIKPFADEIIYELYDFLLGDIRSIMTALRDLLIQAAKKEITKTLSLEEAKFLLAQHRWEEIERKHLTADQKHVFLEYIVQSEEGVTQKDIALKTGKAQSNISGYYFRPLKEAEVIEEINKEGKAVYWDLTAMYRPLKWLKEGAQKITDEVQTSMFN